MTPEQQILSLREHFTKLRDLQQKHTVDLALQGREVVAIKAELGRLEAAHVTHDELTGALGPLRADIALQKQETTVLKDGLAKAATSEQLTNALALMRSDSQVIHRDVAAIQSSMTWITRLIIGTVITAALAGLALLYSAATRGTP